MGAKLSSSIAASDRGAGTSEALEPARPATLGVLRWTGPCAFCRRTLGRGHRVGRPGPACPTEDDGRGWSEGCRLQPPWSRRRSPRVRQPLSRTASGVDYRQRRRIGAHGPLARVPRYLYRWTAQGRDARGMTATRRLAAILAADVAGYSRLMGADEEGTLERLKEMRREFVDPKIAEHRGRIVKTTGDGLLVEFASVVDAVRCAVEFQRDMAERNAGVPPERRIEFRIGINLGDIIIDESDIFGDGVNVAARLEALAEPG